MLTATTDTKRLHNDIGFRNMATLIPSLVHMHVLAGVVDPVAEQLC